MVDLLSLIIPKKTTPATGTTPQASPTLQAQLDKFASGMVNTKDLIAPEALEIDFNFIKISDKYIRTLFIAGYPRFVSANWLSPLINFDHSLDLSMFIYPMEGKAVMDDLRRKITEMEAEIMSDIKQGKIAQIETQIQLEDARTLQEQLAQGSERFYQFGLYVTISSNSLEELNTITKQIQSTLGSLLIVSKSATLQMFEGFHTTLPIGVDRLIVTRNMDTTSLATTFPFTSSELTSDKGIMYGINEHNDSLVIFDRFSMENANMVVFAKSGAGKSYAIKLECLRSLMFDTDIIIIDPEDEYRNMCAAVDGEYIDFTFSSSVKINPFDLSNIYEEGENELGLKILSLHTLLKIMLGDVTAEEEAILDRALIATYKAKGITPDPATQNREPPLMEDLYKALLGMETNESKNLSYRLEKFIKGSFRGIFDQKSNLDIKDPFTVFGIKEMEDSLRPIAMFIILDFIWTRVKRDLKKRLLIVDEAWYLMKYPDSASFLHSLAKRARKYYLGVTTITQDVEDFLATDQGKAIVTNSSIQLLLKQSTVAIDRLSEVFYLSEGEKRLLLSADVGEGLFFAGQNHVAIKVLASEEEHQLITTNPQEILKRQQAQQFNTLSTPTVPITPKAPTPPSRSS
jgi:type IV secretory pathway VirB4 component